jgi:hypothetical protein
MENKGPDSSTKYVDNTLLIDVSDDSLDRPGSVSPAETWKMEMRMTAQFFLAFRCRGGALATIPGS